MQRRIYSRLLSALALLPFCAAGLAVRSHYAFRSNTSTPTEIWQNDLSKNVSFNKRLSSSEVILYPPAIHFLNDSQIVCDFFEIPLVPSGQAPVGQVFHVLEFNAADGSMQHELSFSVSTDHARALPVIGNKIVVFDGTHLQLFDAELKPLSGRSNTITSAEVDPFRLKVDVTPNHDAVVLLYSARDGGFVAKWLRGDDFKEFRSVQARLSSALSISDDAILGHNVSELIAIQANGAIRSLCSSCDGHFINDGLLFISDDTTYHIESSDGTIHAKGNLDLQARKFTTSLLSPLIAYSTGKYIFGLSNRITREIVVLNSMTNQIVSEINMEEQIGNPSAGGNQMSLALSPDGKLLGVLLHHTLTVYRL